MERKRILLALNDSPKVQDLRRTLLDHGYDVKLVHDGSEALTQCREFRPHLVVAELVLAKIDGHHLLREVKAHAATQSIYFVIMSKHRSVEERVHSIELGCDDYITRPFEVDEVLIRLEIILKEIEQFHALPRKNAKGFSGKLSEMNLIEVLQTLEIGKRSALVHLQNNQREGLVVVKRGEIMDASLFDSPPMDALFRMFTWVDGVFRVELQEQVSQQQRWQESTTMVLKQGTLYRDRWLQISSHLPPLQTPIKLGQVNIGQMSGEEQAVLGKLNGNTSFLDVIERSDFDDLSALRMLVNLYKRGFVKEVPLSDQGLAELSGASNGSRNGKDPLTSLIEHFVDPLEESDEKAFLERRRNERRQGEERREHARRWLDNMAERSQIYLNKSELLMIREKVVNHPGEIHRHLKVRHDAE